MNKAEEVVGLVLVARADAAKTKQPGEETFDLPPPSISAQRATVGATPGHGSSWSNQLDLLRGEVFVELLAVVRFVGDEPLRRLRGEALLEGVIDETYFVTLT